MAPKSSWNCHWHDPSHSEVSLLPLMQKFHALTISKCPLQISGTSALSAKKWNPSPHQDMLPTPQVLRAVHHILDHKADHFAGRNRPLSADYFLQLYFFVKTLFTVFKMTFDKKLNQHQLISNLFDIDVGAALACIVKVILWILAFGVG